MANIATSAFAGLPEAKSFVMDVLKAHHDADEIVKGTYWDKGKGGAVGCILDGWGRPARGPFVAFLKGLGLGWTRDYGGGGYEVPSDGRLHGQATQSISVHEAAAKAAAKVFREHGFEAYAASRLD